MKSLKSFIAGVAVILSSAVTAGSALAQDIPGTKSDCDIKPSYVFTGKVSMKMNTSYGGGDPIAMDMGMLLHKEAKYMAVIMEGGMISDMKSVVDFNDSIVVVMMSMGGTKKGMCMDMTSAEFKKQMEKQKETPDYSKFTKIEETKTILGYKCEGYVYSDADKDMKIWITKEIESLYKHYPSSMGGVGGVQLPSGMDGMFMGLVMDDKSSGTHTDMEVTQIDAEKVTKISTDGYSFK